MWMMPLHLHVNQKCDYANDFMTGAPKGSTKSISGEVGNQTCDPCGLQGISFSWIFFQCGSYSREKSVNGKKNVVLHISSVISSEAEHRLPLISYR